MRLGSQFSRMNRQTFSSEFSTDYFGGSGARVMLGDAKG
jgi:hypothetical protein